MKITSNQVPFPPDPLLPLSEVLRLIGVAPSTWWAGIASGKFPPPVKYVRRYLATESSVVCKIDQLNRPSMITFIIFIVFRLVLIHGAMPEKPISDSRI